VVLPIKAISRASFTASSGAPRVSIASGMHDRLPLPLHNLPVANNKAGAQSGMLEQLTSGGYDVYVYAMGGVGARGGGYRILDATSKRVLKDYVRAQGPTSNTDYVEAKSADPAVWAVGNYIVFSGLD